MRFSRAILFGLFVSMAISMLSCSKGKEDIVLAEFKDRTITLAEFEDAYAHVNEKFLPTKSGQEGLEQFLTTMLNKEVMAYKSDELGYDKDQSVHQGVETFKKMGLQAAYLKFKTADRVKVADDLVRKYYNHLGMKFAIKQILVDTPDQAEEVYGMLKDGADFESVCKEYSKAPDAENGGKVSTAVFDAYGPQFKFGVLDLEVGDVTEPIESPFGFFIIKVLKKEDAKQKEPFEEVREKLREEIRAAQEALLANEITDEIRKAANVVWYWDNFHLVLEALPQDRSLTNPPDRREEVYPLLFFDEEDMEKPLVSYNDVTVAVKDFSEFYDRASFFTRPRREQRYGGIKTFLMERVMAVLVPEEMERSKIAEHPEVKAVIDAKREEIMVSRLYEDMVNQQTVVSDNMIRDYYADNTDRFKVPEKRRFGVILTGDIESAQEAYKQIKDGVRFRKVAMDYSIDEDTKETLGETVLLAEGEQPEIDRVGFAMENIGDVSEPFETSKGWMVLKLTERTEASVYTIDEAREQIRSAIKQRLNEERLNELLAKWKEELGVVIHTENLKKAELTGLREKSGAPKRQSSST